jgi:hypothetical protein
VATINGETHMVAWPIAMSATTCQSRSRVAAFGDSIGSAMQVSTH